MINGMIIPMGCDFHDLFSVSNIIPWDEWDDEWDEWDDERLS